MITTITNLLLAVNILVSILLILIVLMQRPKNEGLGAAFGGDSTTNLFGAQTTNVLANITRWLGGIFMVLTLTISVLYSKQDNYKSNIEKSINEAAQTRAAELEKEKAKAAEEAAKAAQAQPKVEGVNIEAGPATPAPSGSPGAPNQPPVATPIPTTPAATPESNSTPVPAVPVAPTPAPAKTPKQQ